MRHGATRRLALTFMLCLGLGGANASADDVVLPDAMLGAQVAPMLLLSRPEVQADLGLTAEQAESARQTLADLRAQALALKGRGDGPEVVAARRAIDEAQVRWLSATLSPDQRTRLSQIGLQWQGLNALTRPLAVEFLGLSEDQVAKLRRALATPPAPNLERSWAESVLAVLSADQRARWKNVLGTPVAFLASAKRPDPAVRRASNPPGK